MSPDFLTCLKLRPCDTSPGFHEVEVIVALQPRSAFRTEVKLK